MRKEIRKMKDGILQVTTTDERWYIKEGKDKKTGLPTYDYVPSVTWIAEHYPKGIAFYKWLASKGWDEAQALKEAAGDKGSKVHFAICKLIDGKEIKIDSKILNPSTEKEEELSLEEYGAVMAFVQWYKDVNPIIVEREFTVWGDGYAGTADLFCRIKDKLTIVDFKTSQYIWPSHELQISAYKHALGKEVNLAILQLGYRRNEKKYKFTEVNDCYDLFLAAKSIWERETKGISPLQKDYPLTLTLNKEG